MGNNTHELDEVEVLERELLQDEEVEEILDGSVAKFFDKLILG